MEGSVQIQEEKNGMLVEILSARDYTWVSVMSNLVGAICLKVRSTERGSDAKEKAHSHTVKLGLTLNLIC